MHITHLDHAIKSQIYSGTAAIMGVISAIDVLDIWLRILGIVISLLALYFGWKHKKMDSEIKKKQHQILDQQLYREIQENKKYNGIKLDDRIN